MDFLHHRLPLTFGWDFGSPTNTGFLVQGLQTLTPFKIVQEPYYTPPDPIAIGRGKPLDSNSCGSLLGGRSYCVAFKNITR